MFERQKHWIKDKREKTWLLKNITVKPRLTATSVIRQLRYYGHCTLPPGKNRHTFSCKTKKTLVNTATPLIRQNFFWRIGDRSNGVPLYIFSVNEFLFLLKNITTPPMFDYSLKDCYFHEVETILVLMNVFAYVKCFNDHTNIIVFYDGYTFVLITKLLTLMEIYIAEMKGKRCSSTGGKKFKRKHNQGESDRDTSIYYNYLYNDNNILPFPFSALSLSLLLPFQRLTRWLMKTDLLWRVAFKFDVCKCVPVLILDGLINGWNDKGVSVLTASIRRTSLSTFELSNF